MKVGWTVEPVFSIRLHDKDIYILKQIQLFFGGIGKIYHQVEINEASFRVNAIKEIEFIIKHFDAYPLLSQKYSDYILFKQVIYLIKNKQHLNLDGIIKIASIKASMNTNKTIDISSDIVPVIRPVLPEDVYTKINPYWISGFTSGDGCFSVSVIKSKAKLKKTSWVRFILTQHKRDVSLIKAIASYFNCGKINQDFKAVYFVVQKLSDTLNIILPFFDKYSLIGTKVKDYEDFKLVCKLMHNKAHLTEVGLEKIVKIKQSMNTLRK